MKMLFKQLFFLGQEIPGKGIVIRVEYTDQGSDIYIWTNNVIGSELYRQSELVKENKEVAPGAI